MRVLELIKQKVMKLLDAVIHSFEDAGPFDQSIAKKYTSSKKTFLVASDFPTKEREDSCCIEAFFEMFLTSQDKKYQLEILRLENQKIFVQIHELQFTDKVKASLLEIENFDVICLDSLFDLPWFHSNELTMITPNSCYLFEHSLFKKVSQIFSIFTKNLLQLECRISADECSLTMSCFLKEMKMIMTQIQVGTHSPLLTNHFLLYNIIS